MVKSDFKAVTILRKKIPRVSQRLPKAFASFIDTSKDRNQIFDCLCALRID